MGERPLQLLDRLLILYARLVAQPEGLLWAEQAVVQDGYQAEELEQAVLKRGRREKNRGAQPQRSLQRLPRLVRRSRRVSQAMGFVDHHQIPWNPHQRSGASRRELQRADHRGGTIERVGWMQGGAVHQVGVNFELLLQLAPPLHPQRGRTDDQKAPFALRHQLRKHQASLNGFSKTHLVGQDAPAAAKRIEREGGCFGLLWMAIHRPSGKRPGQPGWPTARADRQLFGQHSPVERAQWRGQVRRRGARAKFSELSRRTPQIALLLKRSMPLSTTDRFCKGNA